MTSHRDNFSLDTKASLAARAAYRCSFPGCRALTIGPSSEAADATSSVGMACHISAASAGPGARRYRPDMSSEDRRSIGNGIWMCYTHGKLIDTDETRFTTPQLEKWREIAELRARAQVERAARRRLLLFDLDLAPSDFHVRADGTENRIIGEALQDAGVGEIWGTEEMHAVRDCVVELVRNALTHGRATAVNVSIEGRRILITDDGARFDPWTLYSRGSEPGGVLAVKHLLDAYRDNMVLSSSRLGDRNQVIISLVRSAEDVRNATPCHLEFRWSDLTEDAPPMFIETGCHAIYVILPPYISPSDAISVSRRLHWLREDGHPVIFIAEHTSQVVRDRMERLFPGARVMLASSPEGEDFW